MGTRAFIGITNPDNTVTAIYNALDGGLKNLGHYLRTKINTEEKVKELIDFGDIKDLLTRKDVESLRDQFPEVFEEKEFVSMKTTNMVVFKMPRYEEAKKLENIEEVVEGDSIICYAYLFDTNKNKWFYSKGKGLKELKA